MPLIRQGWITRADLRANPGVLYLFGDNCARTGHGGQAREMRGEPNAVGIRVKWKPTTEEDAYFSDLNARALMELIDNDLRPVVAHLNARRVAVLPMDGIGTNLAQLRWRAPKVFAYLTTRLNTLLKWQPPAPK
jgi:hypothetical protein